MEAEVDLTSHDFEVRVTMLEEFRARSFEHHTELKTKLDIILTKLNTMPCDKHDGERKVLEERVSGLQKQVSWIWGIVSVVFLMIVSFGLKVLLK